MVEHLTVEGLARFQIEGRVHTLGSLAMICRARFVRSADLVCMRSPSIDGVRAFGYRDRVDVSPLLGAWNVICERYLVERYNAQLALLPDLRIDEPVGWTRFMYYELFPSLVRDDELVRNILRALGVLPCTSPESAADAVHSSLLNMVLPSDPPPWAPEEDIESWT